jgi:PQ loop repeat
MMTLGTANDGPDQQGGDNGGDDRSDIAMDAMTNGSIASTHAAAADENDLVGASDGDIIFNYSSPNERNDSSSDAVLVAASPGTPVAISIWNSMFPYLDCGKSAKSDGWKSILSGLATLFTGGILLGLFVLPSTSDSGRHSCYQDVSNCLGYTYFLCWSVSFYPQVVTNWRQQQTARDTSSSPTGLSVHFASLNVLGFLCYTIYCTTLYNYNHRGSASISVAIIAWNDVLFAWHALLFSFITWCQLIYYYGWSFMYQQLFVRTIAESPTRLTDHPDQGQASDQGHSPPTILSTPDMRPLLPISSHPTGSIPETEEAPLGSRPQGLVYRLFALLTHVHFLRIVLVAVLVIILLPPLMLLLWSRWRNPLSMKFWIHYVYLLSYCKIGITTIKYMPQVALNIARQSTTGFSIWQILLDFTGGSLSNIQLFMDSYLQYHTSGSSLSLFHVLWLILSTNLAKLCLGMISIFFDVIFMTQHYIIYADRGRRTSHQRAVQRRDS